MTREDLRHAANANLIATYRAIGAAGPEPEFLDHPNLVACRSPLQHPLSNFAICPSVDAETLAAVASWIAPRPIYNLYTFAGLDEVPREEALIQAGFRHSSMLTTLVAGEGSDSGLALRFVDGDAERRAIGRFVAEQFFPRQTPEIKSVVANATVGSAIPLAWIENDGTAVGALMANDDSGVLGVYNFCIETRQRNQGFGRRAMESAAIFARARQRPLVLQCEPRLVDWYESCGFEAIGHVDVWTLDTAKTAVIMGAR